MFGDNIKVHFAGSEQIDFGLIAHEAGVNYFLFTIYPFIASKFGAKFYPVTTKTLFPPKELEKVSKHLIMDSGLFTLMFGAGKGTLKITEKLMFDWCDAIADFVYSNNINASCVEVDCQKVLGVTEAWKIRKHMKERMPDKSIINVFHFEDGKDGLESLIDFADYIAISVPEIRIVKPKTYKEDVYALASHIKDRKPNIDIHLLGCTQKGILERCRFCSSADSTSWQAVNRYGRICGKSTHNITDKFIQESKPSVKKVLDYCGIELTEKRLYYYYYYLSAMLHKKQYTQWCGSQD